MWEAELHLLPKTFSPNPQNQCIRWQGKQRLIKVTDGIKFANQLTFKQGERVAWIIQVNPRSQDASLWERKAGRKPGRKDGAACFEDGGRSPVSDSCGL